MTQTIDWGAGILKPAPSKIRPHKKVMKYPVMCEACGYTRLLASNNARYAVKYDACLICSRREAGKAGFRKLVKKKGSHEAAVDYLIEKRAENYETSPSAPEAVFAAILSDLNIEYKTQQTFNGDRQRYILDFVICDNGLEVMVVEINGYWHKQLKQERDRNLTADHDLPVLFINADWLMSNQRLIKTAFRDWRINRRDNDVSATFPRSGAMG